MLVISGFQYSLTQTALQCSSGDEESSRPPAKRQNAGKDALDDQQQPMAFIIEQTESRPSPQQQDISRSSPEFTGCRYKVMTCNDSRASSATRLSE